MTISREQGLIVFQCDGKRCAEVLETDTGDFFAALAIFDEESEWVRRKVNNEWMHVCLNCQEVENGLAL